MTLSAPLRNIAFAVVAISAVGCVFWVKWSEDFWPKPLVSEPLVYSYRIVHKYPHDPEAFTQGLLWLNGSLYESLGLNGFSSVREVQLNAPSTPNGLGDSKVVREVKNIESDFGEGLVHVGGGELLQLLWRVGDGRRYSALAGEGGYLKRKDESFKTPLHDGWGLEFDGKSLLVTDSGPDVFFLDPKTFALQRKVTVSDQGRTVEMVNELELIDGELWANIFGNECLARISPSTGAVLAWVDLTGIMDRQKASKSARKKGINVPDVLNGIAWDASSRRLFVTGKRWPRLYEIEVVLSEQRLEQTRQHCIPTRNIFREQ